MPVLRSYLCIEDKYLLIEESAAHAPRWKRSSVLPSYLDSSLQATAAFACLNSQVCAHASHECCPGLTTCGSFIEFISVDVQFAALMPSCR